MLSLSELHTRINYKAVSQIAIGVGVAFFIAMGLLQLTDRLETTPEFTSADFLLGVALAVVYRAINAYGWGLILNALGGSVDPEQATRIWLVSESRRWLPGGIWGYASRAAMAPRIGVSVPKASASMFLELVLLMLAAFIISVPGIICYWRDVAAALTKITGGVPFHFIVAFAVVVLLALPVCWGKLKSKMAAVQERYKSLQEMKFDRGGLGRALVFFIAMSGLNGLVTGCLLGAVPGAESVPMSILVAATSIAWIIGFLAVFSPGGLIVREGAIALLLLPWIPYSTGFTLGLLARLVQIFAEIACMVWVVASDYYRSRRDQGLASAGNWSI